MKITRIKADKVLPNDGQIPGLPRNPRRWSVRELHDLKNSLEQTPELVEMRAPIVVKHGGEYVALGGNMRLAALKELGEAEIDCIVLPEGLPVEKLKEIAIKDNTQFGQWDVDELANFWDDMPLADWGVRYQYKPQDDGAAPAPKDDRVVIEIEFTADEFYFVKGRLEELGGTIEDGLLNLIDNGA